MSPAEPQSPSVARPPSTDRIFRSPAGIATGAVSLAVVLGLGVIAVVSTGGATLWKSLAGMLLVVPLLFALTLRPAVFADDDRLRVRNPFRTVTLPWEAVSGLRAGHSNEVFDQLGTKYQLWAIPVSVRGVRQAGYEQMRMVESSLVPGGQPLNRRGLFDAGRPDRPTAETKRLRPSSGSAIDSLRALQEAGAATQEGQGRPEVRWAYEIIVPASVGLVLLLTLLFVT
ncbi:PH domain-containing protein [Streptomyces sp. NPDC054884]|uniref:PH domain-containing protein n=1 Tax=Streptomyces sp. B21-105 TaxID=3039417 RepID=UPI002FEFCC2A